jgi:hypothetical protein
VTIDEQFGFGSAYREFGNRLDLFLELSHSEDLFCYFELSFVPSNDSRPFSFFGRD